MKEVAGTSHKDRRISQGEWMRMQRRQCEEEDRRDDRIIAVILGAVIIYTIALHALAYIGLRSLM